MSKKLRSWVGISLITIVLGGLVYVGAHLEFQDPFAPSPLIKGAQMTSAEKGADPLTAVCMNKEAVALQYKAMAQLVNILDQHHIDYWMTCGTLLGAVRHEGVIPYDDDVDFCIHEKDAERVLALKETLKAVNLGIYQDRTSIKVYKVDGPHVRPKKQSFRLLPGVWFVRRKTERFPTIDIYPTREENGQIVHANPRARLSFSKEIFLTTDIYPLKNYQFGPLQIKGPQNPFNFFNSCYGETWNDVLVYTGNHLMGAHEKMVIPLTPSLRKRFYRYQGE